MTETRPIQNISWIIILYWDPFKCHSQQTPQYNLGNVRLWSNEVTESGHWTWPIKHSIIHIDIQNLSSHLNLGLGYTQGILKEES